MSNYTVNQYNMSLHDNSDADKKQAKDHHCIYQLVCTVQKLRISFTFVVDEPLMQF